MNRKMYSKALSVLLSFMMVFGLSVTAVSADETKPYEGKTVIIYTGNLRGDVDVYPQVAAAKKDFAKQGADVYLVDAGNYLQGTTYANSTRGKAIYDLMDAAGYDVAAMGAYEFAYEEASTGQKYHANFTKYHTQKMLYLGQEEMEYNKNMPGTSKGTLEAVTAPGFKVISSNITGTSSATVDNAAAIGNPEQLYAFDANATLGNEFKVGFAAVTEDDVDGMIQDNYFNGLTYSDSVSLPEADVVIGLSNNAEVENVTGADATIYAPTGGDEIFGACVIDNVTKEIDDIEGFSIDSYTADSSVASAVEAVKGAAHEVIATSDINLIGKNSLHRKQETTMGDLVADALLWYAESGNLEGFNNDVPVVAIQNGGNVRETLYSGDIIDMDLFHAYPYSPAGVGILYVTGEQLLESLEEANQTNPCNAFPHVAGMTYNLDKDAEYDASTTKGENGNGKYGNYYYADTYNRVTITSVGGEDFDINATYAVVADKMVIFNGLDTYGTFKAIKDGYGAEGEGTKWIDNGNGILTRDVVGMYLKEALGGKLSGEYAEPQGRITYKSNEELAQELIEDAKTAAEAAAKAVAKAKASGSVADAEAAVAAANAAKIAAANAADIANKTGDDTLINEAKGIQEDADKAVTDASEAKAAADKAAADKAAADKAAADKAAAEAAKEAASNINKATVTAADIKNASDLGATTVTLGAKVKKIKKNAFKGTNINTVVVKTKKLKAKTVKGSLKGSSVSTVKVDLGKKKVNKTYVKKYKKIFTKKNAGKKAKVK